MDLVLFFRSLAFNFCQFLHFLILSFLVSLIFFGNWNDDIVLNFVLAMVPLGLVIHVIQRKIVFKSYEYFSFSFLFLLSYLIVYFQLAFLKILGIDIIEKLEWFIWADVNNISKPIVIAACGLFAFFLGSSARPKNKIDGFEPKKNTPIRGTVQVLTILAFISYIIFLLTAGSYVFGAYARDAGVLSNYAIRLFNIFMFSSICIELHKIFISEKHDLNIRQYLKSFYFPLVFLLCIHIFMSFLVGDRGPILTYSILFFSVFFIKYYKLKLLQVFLSIIFIGAILSILGETRTRVVDTSFVERFSSAAFSEESQYFTEPIPGEDFVELALSVRTLNYVVRDVPEEFDYQYGLFQLQQLVAIVPGASRVYNNLVFDGDPRYDGTANFVTYLIHRTEVDYGDGTSVVADIYLDFGLIGVIFILFAFGRIMAIYELRMKNGNVEFNFYFLLFMTYLSKALYLPRSSIMLEFSNIIFCLFVIWSVNSIVKRKFIRLKN